MKNASFAAGLPFGGNAVPVRAAEISTHVRDRARGAGTKGMAATLLKRAADGGRTPVAAARTARQLTHPSATTITG